MRVMGQGISIEVLFASPIDNLHILHSTSVDLSPPSCMFAARIRSLEYSLVSWLLLSGSSSPHQRLEIKVFHLYFHVGYFCMLER